MVLVLLVLPLVITLSDWNRSSDELLNRRWLALLLSYIGSFPRIQILQLLLNLLLLQQVKSGHLVLRPLFLILSLLNLLPKLTLVIILLLLFDLVTIERLVLSDGLAWVSHSRCHHVALLVTHWRA